MEARATEPPVSDGQRIRGDVMSSRHLVASVPMACLLAAAFLGTAPAANAEAVKHSAKGKIAASKAIEHRAGFYRFRHYHSVKIALPLGPTSIYYDYPYFYARGHYPTHIGGYVYYIP